MSRKWRPSGTSSSIKPFKTANRNFDRFHAIAPLVFAPGKYAEPVIEADFGFYQIDIGPTVTRVTQSHFADFTAMWIKLCQALGKSVRNTSIVPQSGFIGKAK